MYDDRMDEFDLTPLDEFYLYNDSPQENFDKYSTEAIVRSDIDLSSIPLSKITRALSPADWGMHQPADEKKDTAKKLINGRIDGLNFVKWLLADIKVLKPEEQKVLTNKLIDIHCELFSSIVAHSGTRRFLILLCEQFLAHRFRRDLIANKTRYFRLKQEYTALCSTPARKSKTREFIQRFKMNQRAIDISQIETALALHFPRTLLVDVVIYCLRLSHDAAAMGTFFGEDIEAYKAAPFDEYLKAVDKSIVGRNYQLHDNAQQLLMAHIKQYFETRNQLVIHNMPLVINIARANATSEPMAIEFIQEGISGLVRAAEKFSNTRGARFSTYAYNWIDSKIRAAKVNQTSIIRLSPEVYIELNKLLNAKEHLLARGDKATDQNLASALGVTVARVKWLSEINRNTLSVNHVQHNNEHSEAEIRLPDPSSIIDDAHNLRIRKQLDDIIIDELPQREQTLLTMRFGLSGNKPHTIEAIGKVLGLSPERVRQLEEQCLAIIHDVLIRRGWQSAEG